MVIPLIIQILILILFLLLVAYLIASIVSDAKGAPFLPTHDKKIETITKFLKQEKAKANTFIDLGAGNGKIVFLANDLSYSAEGVEINPLLVLFARIRTSLSRKRKARFHQGNVFNHDCSKYDVVFAYLMPKVMPKLEKKLQKELKPGSVVILESFSFPNWKPEKVENGIYLYRKETK